MLTCPDFSQSKIVVVGDSMLDRYWHGDTSRISPEAPVPVVRIERNEERVGGAGNVALNVQALGARTTLVSVIGDDDAGNTLTALLRDQGIHCQFVTSTSQKTTLKLRVIGRHQQLIRLDFENKHRCAAEEIIEHLMPAINDANVLILSDYAKGVIADPHRIIAFARSKGVTILVDPKNADLSVYRGAHILTPNFGEFEAAVGPCEDEATLERKGLQLMHELGLTGLLVTRGSQGMTVFSGDVITHIPTQTREVFDVTGAGDTVIAVLGACLGAGSSLLEAAQLSNIAAGIVVGKLGTASVSRDELQLAMGTDFAKGPLSEDDLAIQIKRRKAAGDKIVMTNGCFDILHAGHVTYLQQARALGDCLIVAVNDDDSIRRLKGKDRPMNPLAQRMVVLAGLGCVDYVVFFREDTPARLIAKILPDVLVKAADYTPDQIAGASDVINNGGEVKIMPLVEGCSTTNLINQIIRSQIPEVEEVS